MEKLWLEEYDSGVPATIDYPKVPVHQFLLDTAAKYPNNTATIFGGVVEPLGNALMDTTMSYSQLLALAQKLAAALQELGVQKGDRVAVHLRQLPPIRNRLLCYTHGWGHCRALQSPVRGPRAQASV